MKKTITKLTALIVVACSLFTGNIAHAQKVEWNATNFPDPTLREMLKTSGYVKQGTNESALYVETDEVKELDYNTVVGNVDGGVRDLKGLELLTELTSLRVCCENIDITLSNPKLQSLDIWLHGTVNRFSLNLPSLESLDISDEPETKMVETIDLSKESRLKKMTVNSYNMRYLDLSALTNLEEADIRVTSSVTGIDHLSKLKSLSLTDCSGMTTLTLSELPNLRYFDIMEASNLSELDVSKAVNLQGIEFNYCDALKSLNLKNNKKLESVNCAFHDKSGNLSSLTLPDSVKYLSCDNNKISSLTLPKGLVILTCGNNNFKTLDLSKMSKLETLYAQGNDLQKVNISGCKKLKYVDLSDNSKLTAVDVSKNKKLYDLKLTKTGLKKLDVSKNPKLAILEVANTKLKTLDVGKNAELVTLDVANTQLKQLNTKKNTKLVSLVIDHTKISTLDLSNNKKLSSLSIDHSKIRTLDLSNNKKLDTLSLGSQIKKLDLTKYKFKSNIISLLLNGKRGKKLALKNYIGTGCTIYEDPDDDTTPIKSKELKYNKKSGSVTISKTAKKKETYWLPLKKGKKVYVIGVTVK